MSRLPIPASDEGTWGDVLNDYLGVEHAADGTHKLVVNPDATTSTKGKLKLAGDLSGTADSPTVPGLANKATDSAVVHNIGAETVAGVKTFSSPPIVPTPTAPAQAASKSYVDGVAGSGSTPDADAVTKGKVQLAGDLAGTAASPQIAAGVIVDADISASAGIDQGKIANLVSDMGDKPSLTSNNIFFGSSTFAASINFTGTDHAGLQLNSLSTFDRDNLSPDNGMLIYNLDTGTAQYYSNDAGSWIDVTASSGGSGDMNKSSYDPANITQQVVGLSATQTLTNKTLTSPVINTPTGITKTDVGLANVDNTSDATKNTAVATLTNKTLIQPIIRGAIVTALVDAANIATNAALGNIFTVTLGDNRTIDNPTNPTDGQKMIYRLKQDATGSRTVSWGSAFRFGTDVPAPTLTTTAAKTDYIGFIYHATDSKWDCLAVSRGF